MKRVTICETTYFWEMIVIFGKGFISCLTSSNNLNLHLLSCQKIYTLLGIIWNMWPWSSDYARLSFGVHWYLNRFYSVWRPFTPKSDLIDFTLSHARQFYSSKGDPLGVKGLNSLNPFTPKTDLTDFTLSGARRFYSSKGDPLGVP